MAQVSEAMAVAEDCVGEYYQLSEANWLRYAYELRTLRDLAPREVTTRALAQVLKMRQPAEGKRLRSRDFFRICLQDHNLLNLTRREGAGDLLLPLLTYVLAHELVHVVRFYSFQHLFDSFPQHRDQEETKVHGITSKILSRAPLPKLGRVLNLYEKHGGDEVIAAV